MSSNRGRQHCHFNNRNRGVLTSMLIGLSVGIGLSLVITSVFDEDCFGSQLEHPSGGRSLQQSDVAASLSEFRNEDYEPELHLEGKPKSADGGNNKNSKTPVRSRFYSTELGIKEKLLVAVMSDRENSLKLLGEAINITSAHHVNKLIFFTRQSDEIASTSKTVIKLPEGPDLLYPFQVLTHINEHYGNEYDYIFIVPGNVYIRGRQLLRLVSSISISQHVYMGKPIEDSSLKDSAPLYCDIRSGIIISQSILKAIVPDMDWCKRNSFSDDPSDNIGRCILHSTSIPCSRLIKGNLYSSMEVEKTFYYDSDIDAYSLEREFNNAVTVHPMITSETIFKLHLYYTQLEMRDNQKQILELRLASERTNTFLPEELRVSTWPQGSPIYTPVPVPRDRLSVIDWDYLTLDKIYKDGDHVCVRNLTSSEREDLHEVLNNAVNRLQRSDNNLKFIKMLNAYRRFDPTRGMEYQLDLVVTNSATGMAETRRMEAIRLLGNVELIPMPYVTENTQLVMLLPVTPNSQADVIRFLKNFAEVCLEKQDNAILVLIFLRGPNESEEQFVTLKNLIATYNHKYQTEGAKLSSTSFKMNAEHQPTAFAVIDLVTKKFSPETLFLLCQPGMEIRSEYLNRARMNSIAGWQVFFPIPFTQYHPGIVYRDREEPTLVEIGKNYGHFDQHDFGYFSFYNSDYQAGRKLIESVVPIAKTDRDMKNSRHRGRTGHDIYEMFLQWGKVHVMRAVEPSLRIRYGERRCDSSLKGETLRHCEKARTEQLASRSQLAALLLLH